MAETRAMRHGRLPWPGPEELDAAALALHREIIGGRRADGSELFETMTEDGRLHGPFNAMLFAPAIGWPLQALGSSVRYDTSLTDREREIAILTVAAARDSGFEWYAHSALGRHVGLTEAELNGLAGGQVAESFDARESMLHHVVSLLLIEGDVGDDDYAAAELVFGHAQLMEIVVLVGYYDLLALSLRFWRTPLPAGASTSERARPPAANENDAAPGRDCGGGHVH